MLILLTGLPGAGKSTAAQLLAERMDGIVVNSDAIRKELFPHARSYSPKETGVVIQETRRRVRKILSQGNAVILDALFTKQNAREEYRSLAQEFDVPFRMILITATDEAVEERLALRPETDDSSEATYEFYLDRKKYFERVVGLHTVIDNSGSVENLREQVRRIGL